MKGKFVITLSMRGKVGLILLGFAALGGFGYLVNRISTQLHPYGNWVLVGLVIIVAAIVGAYIWSEAEKDTQ